MVVKALDTITLARVDDGTPGSQDVPMTYVQTAQPSGTIVKDSLWWVGDTMSSVTALKRWNGSSWIPETISQDVLNVISLNAVDITGSTISGSEFVSSFSGVQPNGATFTVHGTSTIENGALSTIAYKDSDNSLYSTTNVSPVDIGSVLYDSGTKFDEIRLREGQLYLGSLYKSSASANPNWEGGVITAAQLLELQRSGTVLWSGVSFMQADFKVTPSLRLDQCLFGWNLVWHPYENNTVSNDGGIIVTPVYKAVALNVGKTHAWNFPLYSYNHGNAFLTKYVYVGSDGTFLLGNSQNNVGNSRYYVLTQVVAF